MFKQSARSTHPDVRNPWLDSLSGSCPGCLVAV